MVKTSISLSTLRRYSKKWGIYYGHSVVLPMLKEDNKIERLEASSKNFFVNYKNIMFSDESIIRLRDVSVQGYTVDRRILTPQIIKGNSSIMVWGAFSYFGYTDLEVFISRMGIDFEVCCNVLEKHLPKLISKHPNNKAILLQDNAST